MPPESPPSSPSEQVLWTPDEGYRTSSNLARYRDWLAERVGSDFADYQALWHWSVDELEEFWRSVWDFYGVEASEQPRSVLDERRMPGAEWFPGAHLNYAAHMLRCATPERPAVISQREDAEPEELGWAELTRQSAALAATLRAAGVGSGDTVVAYLPNCPAAIIGLLACASVGATWSACGPEFGTRGVVERFQQLAPKVLLAADGYRFGGRDFDRTEQARQLVEAMPSVELTVFVGWLDADAPLPDVRGAISWDDATAGDHPLAVDDVPFDHPLWVLFSSGTTGKPKGIVHGHGGILLEHLKVHGLMNDVRPGDRVLFICSTTWMVWNTLVSSLLAGATVVLFDGNPMHPQADTLWRMVEEQRVSLFGTGAGYIHACQKAGVEPGRDRDLSSLRCVLVTGSPLSTSGFRWVYDSVGDVWLSTPSGGTDVCSSFLGACCLEPVVAGRLQPPALGVAAAAFDDRGRPVYDQLGELVITEPMPSMPTAFWGDPTGERLRASYFDQFPGVWRHGDLIEFSRDGYSVISGRSDSTLNRRGIRMGSAEIYAAVEALDSVAESLVVGVELPDADYYMPLFVATRAGVELDDALIADIVREIRRSLSPRHVPDEIFAVAGIPHTKTGKKLELPIKRLYQGAELDEALDLGSVDDPALMRAFADRARAWLAERAARQG